MLSKVLEFLSQIYIAVTRNKLRNRMRLLKRFLRIKLEVKKKGSSGVTQKNGLCSLFRKLFDQGEDRIPTVFDYGCETLFDGIVT